MSSYGEWNNYKGYMSLWKVKYWAWDGQSREIDPHTGSAVESLNTDFIHAFTEEHLYELIESELVISTEKVESFDKATEDEDYAWSSGWSNGWEMGRSNVER